jgi:hypothetical protein
MRTHTARRLSTLETLSHPSNRNVLSASVRQRLSLPFGHFKRRNQYQAFPTRLSLEAHQDINTYLALPDKVSTVGKFLASVTFVRDITGYTFIDRHLLLQALYGDTHSGRPHQRLALLGDIVLEYILIDDWFQLGLPTSESQVTCESCARSC